MACQMAVAQADRKGQMMATGYYWPPVIGVADALGYAGVVMTREI